VHFLTCWVFLTEWATTVTLMFTLAQAVSLLHRQIRKIKEVKTERYFRIPPQSS
jgi:hypothetical protein